MNAIELATAAAAVLGAGAYLRWAVTPVLTAYRIGKLAAILTNVNREDR
jgi:hypothetical protein